MIDRIVNKYLNEDLKTLNKYREERRNDSTSVKCMEYGHSFKRKIGKGTYEIKCPNIALMIQNLNNGQDNFQVSYRRYEDRMQ